MLGLVHLLIWSRDRRSWANLCFSVMVLGVFGLAIAEMVTMHTESPEVFGRAMRWSHLIYGVGVAGSLGFVHFYFGTGKRRLLALALGLRLLAVVMNFATGLNLHVSAIHSLAKINFLGDQVSVLGEWVANPWIGLGWIASLLQLVYVVDASLRLWRTGSPESRKRAVIVGGTFVIYIVFSAGQAGLVATGVLRMPFMVSFPFLGMVLAMGYELSRNVLRAAQLARELRESKERIDLAADAAGLVVWTWDIPRDEVWLSHKDRVLLGFSQREKLNAERIRSVVHPEDRQFVRQLVEKSLTTSEEIEIEYRLVLPDGKVRWVIRRGRVEFGGDGKPAWERGVLMNITERKQAEEKFRMVVEASPNGIVLVNPTGQMVLVNAQTEKLFGYAREELIGQSVEILVPERFRGAHPGHRAGFLAAPKARAMGAGRELFARRKDGTEFAVEIGISPIETDQGMLVLGAIVDISARKQAELDAQRHRAELAHLSRVALMGEMSASLAHELNQPLAGILSNAAAGQRFIDGGQVTLPELRELLADIGADGRRAGDVVRSIRNMVKKGEPVRQQTNLNEVVMNVVQIVNPDALLRSCEVKTSLEPNLPAIEGDPIQLRQVLLNLVINAFDAMRDTPVVNRKVEIATEWNDNGAIRTSVRDYGVGILEETSERLFDPFFTTKAEGLGMGLAIVRSIVESHGGTMAAENVEGGGALFHFTLSTNVPTSG